MEIDSMTLLEDLQPLGRSADPFHLDRLILSVSSQQNENRLCNMDGQSLPVCRVVMCLQHSVSAAICSCSCVAVEPCLHKMAIIVV
jgi:hypothetical protein